MERHFKAYIEMFIENQQFNSFSLSQNARKLLFFLPESCIIVNSLVFGFWTK